MNTKIKYMAAATLAGALALAAVTPSDARDGRNAALIGGFAAGAVVGAAAANANAGYYGPGYGYYDPGYAYGPAYGYYDGGPYVDSYAYAPGPYYAAPQPYYRGGYRSSAAGCGASPASPNANACN